MASSRGDEISVLFLNVKHCFAISLRVAEPAGLPALGPPGSRLGTAEGDLLSELLADSNGETEQGIQPARKRTVPDPASGRAFGPRLLNNSAWNTTSFVCSTLIAVLAAPVYMNYLGLGGYGLFITLNTILAPLALMDIGFGPATIKFVSECCASHRESEAGRYLQSTLFMNLAAGLLGTLAIWLAAAPLADVFRVTQEVRHTAIVGFRLVAVGWVLNQLGSTYMAVPIALQQYRLNSTMSLVVSVTTVGFGLLVLALHGSLIELMAFRTIWGGVAAISWWRLARHLLPSIPLWPKYCRGTLHKCFHFGVWQTAATIGGIMAAQADKFLLMRFWGVGAVGIYAVPTAAYQQGYGLVARLADVLFPAISNLQGRGRDRESVRLMLSGSWLIGLFMVAVQGTLYIHADDLLRLYMHGKLPSAATTIMRLCCLGAIITAATPGVVQFLLGTGRTGWIAAMSISAGVITMIFQLVLVPGYGVDGAAWGGFLAVLLTRPLVYFVMWFRLLRKSTPFWTQFSALFGCSMPGVVLVFGLAALGRHLNLRPGWIALGTLCLLTFIFLLAMLIWINRFLPGSAPHLREVHAIARWVLGWFKKSRRRAAGNGNLKPDFRTAFQLRQ